MEFDVGEDFLVGPEVHFGAALVGFADHLDRGDFEAVDDFDFAVLRNAAHEFHLVDLAFLANGHAQQLRQRVHAGHAHAVQAARHLVRVLVELAAGVQFGQGDFGRRALRLVLVVHLDAGRNAAAVVGDRDRIVRVDRHVDFGAVAGQRFVDRVVQHFEDEVVQAGAVRGVANVHARPLADRFQAFQNLNRGGAVIVRLHRRLGHVIGVIGHGLLSQKTVYSDCCVGHACCG